MTSKDQDLKFRGLLVAAHISGMSAGHAARPTPMGFYQSDLSGRQLGPVEIVSEGVCGFAWVRFPGNTAFGRWAKKTKNARPAYPKGLSISCSEFNQSMERKEAYCRAFAEVLKANGVDCCTESRLD